ncbi:conjugal transfer protein TraI, partial [Escherichia coli]
AESPAETQALEQWNKLSPIVSHIRPDFPEPYGLPVDGLQGKNEYF